MVGVDKQPLLRWLWSAKRFGEVARKALFRRTDSFSPASGMWAAIYPKPTTDGSVPASVIRDCVCLLSWYRLGQARDISSAAVAVPDPRTVAELMGHKTIQITMRYAHLAPAHNLAAVERLIRGLEGRCQRE